MDSVEKNVPSQLLLPTCGEEGRCEISKQFFFFEKPGARNLLGMY
jgi:hypothetical protein